MGNRQKDLIAAVLVFEYHNSSQFYNESIS